MATAEIKDFTPFDIFDDRYLAQLFVTDEVVKGMTIAPLLGMDTTEAKSVDWFTREHTTQELIDKNLIQKPMPAAQGAQLLEVSGSELTRDKKVVETFGYKYVVDQQDLEDNPKPFLEDIKDHCYQIANKIEDSIVKALITAATISSAEIIGGSWSASTKIDECIKGFADEYLFRDINGFLDTSILSEERYKNLTDFIVATEGMDKLKEKEGVVDYNNKKFNFARKMSPDAFLGWYSELPPGDVMYRKIKGCYEPIAQKEGAEEYIPAINMKIIDSDGKGMDPIREFRFAASWMVPILRPQSIFYKTGI
ncbi:hypothetical protein SDC9_30518 [bioreactor metagenome]|uniref:Uncharacterized protein n=1 Tax=bioreactor metagenome TaxID=1076179 RepID=A0A644V0X7_9ZZZZ|nr:hypothetical protein [Methanobrevibacter sp.]MEA4957549.1 hypothetical protein [Methanobrevibacter sp.]